LCRELAAKALATDIGTVASVACRRVVAKSFNAEGDYSAALVVLNAFARDGEMQDLFELFLTQLSANEFQEAEETAALVRAKEPTDAAARDQKRQIEAISTKIDKGVKVYRAKQLLSARDKK